MFSKNTSDEKAKLYVERLLHSKNRDLWIKRITSAHEDYEISYHDGVLRASKLGLLIFSKLLEIAQSNSEDAKLATTVIEEIESKCRDIAASRTLNDDCRCILF